MFRNNDELLEFLYNSDRLTEHVRRDERVERSEQLSRSHDAFQKTLRVPQTIFEVVGFLPNGKAAKVAATGIKQVRKASRKASDAYAADAARQSARDIDNEQQARRNNDQFNDSMLSFGDASAIGQASGDGDWVDDDTDDDWVDDDTDDDWVDDDMDDDWVDDDTDDDWVDDDTDDDWVDDDTDDDSVDDDTDDDDAANGGAVPARGRMTPNGDDENLA